MSTLWAGVIVATVVLVALVIFIAQNSGEVTIHYLGARVRVSLAVALILSAVAGVLILAVPSGARILQLRKSVKHHAAAAATAAAASSAAAPSSGEARHRT